MSYGHIQAALENKEGAERAREDFAAGIRSNPFGTYAENGWRGAAYDQQYKFLVNARDCKANHPQNVCCWEHERHLKRWDTSQWGITSCPVCEDYAALERKVREAAHKAKGK